MDHPKATRRGRSSSPQCRFPRTKSTTATNSQRESRLPNSDLRRSLISNLYTEPKDLEAKHSTHSLAELYVISNEQVGLSPRSFDKTTVITTELPEFTKLSFCVRSNLPDLNFTSIGVRVGGKLNAHKDMNTTGMSAVLSGSANRPCLFWCFNSEGSCLEEFVGLGQVVLA